MEKIMSLKKDTTKDTNRPFKLNKLDWVLLQEIVPHMPTVVNLIAYKYANIMWLD